MSLWQPTRRELIKTAPIFLGAAALPRPLFSAEPKPLRFFVIGDWGRNGAHNQAAVGAQMGHKADTLNPDFVVTTGDNFYVFGVPSWNHSQWNTSFERIYTSNGLRYVPWFATLGNHDYYGNVEAQVERTGRDPFGRWKLPRRWYSVPDETSQDPAIKDGFRDVDLFFIDTVAWRGEKGWLSPLGSGVSIEDRRDQAKWLVAALRNSRARYKFVFGHHGIFQIGSHGGSRDMAELHDILHKYGVAAYVHGHDHCMYHVTYRGVHHICSGAGSAIRTGYKGDLDRHCVVPGLCSDLGDSDGDFPMWHRLLLNAKNLSPSLQEHYDLKGGFATFEVHPEAVTFAFVDQFGQVRYSGKIPPRTSLTSSDQLLIRG